MDWGIGDRSGMDSSGRLIRKCPGVWASIPSVASGSGVSGLEFRHALICVRMVVISSKVSFVPPITTFKCF